MNDLEMLNHVLENGTLSAKELEAFTDMASHLAASGKFTLKPKQKAWVERAKERIGKELLPMVVGQECTGRKPASKDREFALKEKPCLTVNCGQLPLFPPGGSSNSPRHNAR
jgi:hypothetical protein